MSTAETVGFIGLGQMGFGIARNLLAAGYDVLAYDIAAEPLICFTAQGGRAVRHPAQIGATCQRVMIMVVSGEQVEAVMSGQDGLLQTMIWATECPSVFRCALLRARPFAGHTVANLRASALQAGAS